MKTGREYYLEVMRGKFDSIDYIQAILGDNPQPSVYDQLFAVWLNGYELGAEEAEADTWEEAYENGYKHPREG